LFIFARFIQGIGAVAPSVVGWVMIQDLYPGDEGSKILSWVGAIVSVGPFAAPSLGGYVHTMYGWQGNFLGLLIFTIPLTFGWTMVKINGPVKTVDQRLSLGKTFATYQMILKNKIFLGYVFMFSLLGAGEICYLTVSPFYFEKVLHLSPDVFGLYLSGSASFYIFGTLCTNSIMKKFGVEITLKIGAMIAVLGSLILVGTALFIPHTINMVALSFCFYFFGAAIVWGPSTSRAIQQFESEKGSASAVRSLILMGFFSLGGFIGSLLNDISLIPLSGVIVLIATTSLIIVNKVAKK
jgi:MFS family permease